MTDTGDPVALSGDLVVACKAGEDPTEYLDRLAELDRDRLLASLDSDDRRKAFWINVYNAAIQAELAREPDRYEDRRSFFRSEWITVAGQRLSPDDVEHGILRKGQLSVGLGYVRKPGFLLPEFVRAAAVDEVDPRIHFALNCGAAACPPIAAYSAEGIDRELDVATESYLGSEVEYDPEAGRAEVPRLLLWFRGDFGGRSGIYRLLREHGPVPGDARPSVSYRSYDWSLELGKFADEPVEPPSP